MANSVTILGSTGVIGQLTLDVLRQFNGQYRVAALAAGRNWAQLAAQIREFHPQYVSVQDDETRTALVEELGNDLRGVDIGVGQTGLIEAASVEAGVVVTGIVGAAGLLPTWAAIERGATIALANKETLVAAGDLVMPFALERNASIIPVDSEHSALFQCLLAGRADEVKRYLVTASGGPFRNTPADDLHGVSVADALRHPTWSMGKKITIDSATLMNKGLEVIEAHHLFGAPYDKINVLVHPQSVIHSMIEYQDGSIIAQLGSADMRIPIQYALTHPSRCPAQWPTLDFLQLTALTFELPDIDRFRCLGLAYQTGQAGGYAPCIMNAANEIAVAAFLNGSLGFLGIPQVIEAVLSRQPAGTPRSVEDIVQMDAWARQTAHTILEKGGWN